MSFNNIIKSITSSFFEGKENFLYFSTPTYIMKEIPSLLQDKDLQILNLQEDYTPLKPFLNILSKYKPKKETINKNTYILQQDTFNSFFETGKTEERLDEVILEELYFEQKECHLSIINLLKQLTKGNYLIQNAQELSFEALEIIKKLSKTQINCKFIFVFDIEELENAPIELHNFIEEIENSNNYFKLTEQRYSVNNSVTKQNNNHTFELLINSLRSNRLFFSFTQAKQLAKWIIKNSEDLTLSSIQKKWLYFEIALIYYFLKETDEASVYLTTVLEGNNLDDEELASKAAIYMARILLYKNANISALKYIKLALKNLESKKDTKDYAIAYMVNYEITERTDSNASVAKYEQTQTLLNDQGLLNNSIHTSLVMPWSLVDDITKREGLIPKVDNAISYAEKIGNKFALSTAYHWKGILNSFLEGPDKALEWYFKCNEIRTEIGEISSIIKIRNGLSYEYLTRSDYIKSYDLINSFINKVITIKDYPEIIITLNNIVKSLFFSRHFVLAQKIIKKILHLMRLFNLEEASYYSFFPEYNDVLIFKSLTDFCNEEFMHSKITLHNIKTNARKNSTSTVPLIHLGDALHFVKDGYLEEAEKSFNSCFESFISLGHSSYHCAAFACYEMAITLKANGHEDKTNSYIDKAFELARTYNLVNFLTEDNQKLSLNSYLSKENEINEFNLDLSQLIQNAEKDRLMNQLHRKLRDSQFLNRVMSFGYGKVTEKNYIHNFIQASFDYTMANAIYIAEKSDFTWKILDSISKTNVNIPTQEDWESLYQITENISNLNSFYDKEKNLIYANISRYDFTGAIIIYPEANINVTSEDLITINIALSNLQAHIVMLKQNEHLLFISSTDQLSMLKNRRALQEQLSIQSEMVKRYNNKRAMYFQLSIIFIDMDNFKFYNDTYGHDAGDMLIAKFGDLLKKVFRRVDFISRFGGDEFVALLPNTNCEEAHRAAQRLHEALHEANYFIPDLTDLLQRSIDVPKERLLGFSTGICSNFDIKDPTNMELTMTNADKALYYSKHTRKGSISIWKNIKDLLPQNED